jgi:MFS family permease
MTRNLKLFALFSVVWSIPFFMVLHWMLFNPESRGPIMLLASPIYGIGFSVAGHHLGKRDDQSKVRYGLGIRYGLTSTIASILVAGVWIVGWRHNHSWELLVYGIILVLGLGVAYILSKNSIKSIPKQKLFK